MSNPENSTIGFCHQTFYDHTLARAFACGSKSLAEFVLERQDGLFVRPTLLRSLNYLRGTSIKQYETQLTTLLTAEKVRLHIRNLLIEFLGAQSNPKLFEAKLLIPLLKEPEGIKVMDAMVGSQGWFNRLRNCSEFIQWLEKPVEQARYCSLLLATATNFASEDVWNLLEKYWLDNQTYDLFSIKIISNISQWNCQRVWHIQQVIERSSIDWDSIITIAENIGETLPDYAARVIHAHLNYLSTQTIETSNVPLPELSPDADETERSLYACRNDPLNSLKHLLETESDFYQIEKFAKTYSKSFLESIWSWFTSIIQQLAELTNPNVVSYRSDRLLDFTFSRSKIIQSLLNAIIELAKQDKSAFLKFVQQNADSDLLVVHRLLAFGLEVVASEKAIAVLNYLLADPRRLSLGCGSSIKRHSETQKLIAAIFPHLQPEDRKQLEENIKKFTYWQIKDQRDADFRRKFLGYNREHRLFLLQAIPDQYLSPQTRRLKEEEERAFPRFNLEKSNGTNTGGFIGSRMTKEEMSRASDENLLNLFNKLSDETGSENPHYRWSKNVSRAGGAIQQSGVFGELVKDDRSRFLRILPQLKPQHHENYVGQALENLAETDFPANDLICLIEELDRRGFSSEQFRSDAAHALQKIAERDEGLPPSSLSLLKSWLPNLIQPELAYYRSQDEQASDLRSPILFGISHSHMLSGGRGNIVRAIAEGYLKQNPQDLAGWAEFIRSQLNVERHPTVWVDILTRMPLLLNSDRTQATELFDRVIRNSPEVLQNVWALYIISRAIGWFEPQETVQGWLEILNSNNSNLSQQAYGEMLLIQHLQYQDEWSVNRIRHHLTTQDSEATLCGLAHVASYLYLELKCPAIVAEILCTLASSSAKSIQCAVAQIFRWKRDRFKPDREMLKIIEAVCKNQGVLLEAANDLTEIIEAEELVDNNPEIVVEVLKSLLSIGVELTNPARSTAFIAENLTTIAIKLHRQPSYREVGLEIFEQLLVLNFRETRSALEMLDRRPTRLGNYVFPRRRLLKDYLPDS